MKKSTTVFLVEDDEDDRYSFVSVLATITDVSLFDTAVNGKEALEKLRLASVLPEMIFVDYQMPVMNGVDFLMAKLKDAHIRDIPVVMLSSSNEIREHALHIGAKAFIKKPSSDTELKNEMEDALKTVRGNN